MSWQHIVIVIYFALNLCLCPFMVGRRQPTWTTARACGIAAFYCFLIWLAVTG